MISTTLTVNLGKGRELVTISLRLRHASIINKAPKLHIAKLAIILSSPINAKINRANKINLIFAIGPKTILLPTLVLR